MEPTPFPTVFEIIRFIAKHLGTKASNKKLDDLAKDVFADYRKIPEMIEKVISGPIEGYASPYFAELVSSQLNGLLDEYLVLVSKLSADGMERGQILHRLMRLWFVPKALEALKNIFSCQSGLPSLSLLIGSPRSALWCVFEWAEQNIYGWTSYLTNLEKEQRDQIQRWKNGKNLPNLSSLKLLETWDLQRIVDRENWLTVKILLGLSRAIDSLQGSSIGLEARDEVRVQYLGARPDDDLFSFFEGQRRASLKYVGYVRPHLEYLDKNLKRIAPKDGEAKEGSRFHLDELRNKLEALDESDASSVKLDLLEGRWHVLSGDLTGACGYYEKALEAVLYRSGNEIKEILKEALCVACKANSATLMRKARNSQIVFKIELESVNQQLVDRPSKKIDDFMQTWEINVWAKEFDQYFPDSYRFQDASHIEESDEVGFLKFDTETNIRPVYKSPNKKIKIGDNRKKTWPQICWFILKDDYETVHKLIDNGARVDVASSMGDTPLIMALEKLAFMEIPYRSMDGRFLDLVLSTSGVEKTVNRQSQKLKLTPIIQAVYAGRPDIVKKLLELGAYVDLRGGTDDQTALNVCLKLIGALKQPEAWKKVQQDHPLTDEFFDAFRRYSNGVMGPDLASQEAFLKMPGFWEKMSHNNEVITNLLLEHTSLSDMREILRLLMKADADSNVTFNSPLKGYTPTMLAAEIDLREELEMMLPCGADLNKTFRNPKSGLDESSWQIAKRCKSKRVLQLMEDIEPYYSSNYE